MKKILFALLATLCLASCTSKEYLYEAEAEEQTPQIYNDEQTPMIYTAPVATVQKETKAEEVVLPAEEKLVPLADVNLDQRELPYTNLTVQELQTELSDARVRIAQEGDVINIAIPYSVIFGTNQRAVQSSFEYTLSALAQKLKEYRKTMIQIIGHTDNTGSYLANKNLSLQKANVVADFLKSHGVNSERILAIGMGSEEPFTSNESVEGRNLNRRIEIRLMNIQ